MSEKVITNNNEKHKSIQSGKHEYKPLCKDGVCHIPANMFKENNNKINKNLMVNINQ